MEVTKEIQDMCNSLGEDSKAVVAVRLIIDKIDKAEKTIVCLKEKSSKPQLEDILNAAATSGVVVGYVQAEVDRLNRIHNEILAWEYLQHTLRGLLEDICTAIK